MRIAKLLVLVTLVAMVPGVALAADKDLEGFVLHVRRDAVVAEGTSVRTVVVVDADVRVAGEVENLVVIRGTAVVSGRVTGNITVIRGDLELEGRAVVHDVSLLRSDLVRATGATVEGRIRETSGTWWLGWSLLFGLLFIFGLGLALLLAGLVFAAVGAPTLGRAVDAMSNKTGQTILAGLCTMIGLPILAIVALVTIVGIPIGLGILVLVLPALAFLGYIVAGTWLGSLIFRRRAGATAKPIREALVGLALLLLVVLIPGLGWLAFTLLGTWGSGALVYLAWRNLRGTAGPPPAGEPAALAQPVEPAEPAAPAQPTESAAAPSQPTEPAAAPAQPTEPAAPSQPTEPAAAPAQPTEPATPARLMEP